jgi:tryptophan synthase alpha chain
VSGPARVRDAFDAAAADGRCALIAYVMAGYPTEIEAVAAAEAAIEGGADLLEIGVPFSDPLADGPTIADAGRVALASGGGLPSALRLVASLRASGHATPILVMSYLNPLMAAGEHETLAALREAGADGIIVPDLPAGAAPRLERLVASLGLAFGFLVAPNSSAGRLEAAILASTGFVYVVPLFGVTGARESVASGARELIADVSRRAAGRAPVAAGFGLSTPAQVAQLAAVADGLVIGSALVTALKRGGPGALRDLVRDLAAGTARAASG